MEDLIDCRDNSYSFQNNAGSSEKEFKQIIVTSFSCE